MKLILSILLLLLLYPSHSNDYWQYSANDYLYERHLYDLAIFHIKQFENYKATLYTLAQDTLIGYGHKISAGDNLLKSYISKKEALKILHSDFKKCVTIIKDSLQGENPNIIIPAALISYNMGLNRFFGSKLYDLIKGGRYVNLETEWPKWSFYRPKNKHKRIKSIQLEQRRNFELILFLNR